MKDLDLAQGVHWAIERFAKGELTEPVHVAMGRLYLVPSASDVGEFYIVAHCQRLNTTRRRIEEVWLCGCKGYRFSKKGDTCKHIQDIQRRVGWQPKNTSSGTKSGSKRVASKKQRAGSGTTRAAAGSGARAGKTRTSTSKRTGSKSQKSSTRKRSRT